MYFQYSYSSLPVAAIGLQPSMVLRTMPVVININICSFIPSKFRHTGSRSCNVILSEESFVYLRIHNNLHDSPKYDQLLGTQVAFLGNKKRPIKLFTLNI